MMTKLKLISILFLASCFGFAQQYPSVINLRGTPQVNGTIRIQFTISTSTFTTSGFDLQRSSDSAFSFVSVYNYPGAVGGLTAQDFSYDDYPPDPSKKYYYKIVFSNGSQSNTIMVNLGDIFGNYKISQHPITDDGSSRLEFGYKQGQIWMMDIAHPKGYLLYRFGNIVQNSITLNASWFDGTGIYFFRLYTVDGENLIKGKFVVLKKD